ncbi:uncharacterized protein LOC100699988 [Oreochromis niloticus]|uniref:uncharacterized protein LOC100699988 n=1 Tax=Oreochromis niloticus TaxID=8128 RepID=UPI000DF37432|nr:uncharacterized protein LOC100699988 [Oreochromis niloticus]
MDVRMGHSLLCLLGLFLLSTVIHGNTEGGEVKVTLTADRLIIPAGGSVTLTCDVKHSDLKYEWFRETSSAVKSTEAAGSDKVIRISKECKYQCRGWRTDKTSLIAQSDPVIIQETADFKNVI